MKILMAIIFIIASLNAVSQSYDRRTCSAKKISESNIKIDGLLNEQEWLSANWENGFIQSRPHEGENRQGSHGRT